MIKLLINILILIYLINNLIIFEINGRRHRHHHKIRHSRSPFSKNLFKLSSSTPTDFQFTSSFYNLSIYENSIGQKAIALNPSSAQMVGVWVPKGYNQIQFRITEGDNLHRFTINSQRLGNFAFLHLEYKDQMDVLNRELQSEFNLIILATAKRKRGIALEAITKINIHVLDENDNPPMFKKLNYKINLNILPLPINTQIIQLEAFDADEGLNGELYYSLINPSNYFYIEQTTGWLRNFVSLDSIKIPTNITLEVKIEDRASRLQNKEIALNSNSQLSLFNIRNKATIEIQILDENKILKQPKLLFNQIYFQPIIEFPVRVALIEFADKELKNKENINLLISRLNTQFIWNCAWIDRLNLFQFALNICPQFPRDLLGLEEILIVRITVTRLIDTLNGKIGAILWQFEAQIINLKNNNNNKEEEEEGKIKYKILRQQQKLPFELDQFNGQLKLISSLENSLLQKEWNISVIAQLELGNLKKSLKIQSIPIFVKLIFNYLNNNCPQFLEIPLNNLIILQNKHLNFSNENIIWKAKVNNSKIIYKLMNDYFQLFDINPFNGELKIIKEWPNNEKQINIKILAINMEEGIIPFKHQTILNLIILKEEKNIKNLINYSSNDELIKNTCLMENKYSPKFIIPENELIGEIEETAKINTTIGYIKAIDEDEGINGLINYWLINTFNNSIGIDQNNGRVFVNGKIKREIKNEIENNYFDILIEVLVLDMAINKEKQKGIKKQFKIRINSGKNKYYPVFEYYSYRIAIREENQPNIELIQLKALDKDFGDNGKIKYKLIFNQKKELNNYIYINSLNGIIYLNKSLDREYFGEQINFIAMASDFGIPQLKTFTNITLILDDINDQHPEYWFEIIYNIINENNNNKLPFRLDKNSGCLFLNLNENLLNYEIKNEYKFNIKLNDKGTPNLESLNNCLIKINLIKVFNYLKPERPKFSEIALEANILENSPIGTNILRLNAEIDEEIKGKKEINYKIVGGNGFGFFEINSKNGMLKTKKELDFEQKQSFWLTIRAEYINYNNNNKLINYSLFSSTHQHLLIKVINQNDRLPLFSMPFYNTTISENSEENIIILKLEATDADDHLIINKLEKSINNSIKYSIINGDPKQHFIIDEYTGYLLTNKNNILDREIQSKYLLTINACDIGLICSTCLVQINIKDENDNLPLFDLNYLSSLKFQANTLGFLGKIFAIDFDSYGPNSNIKYWLEPSNNENIEMDINGYIFAKIPLKAGTLINFDIFAEDEGNPPLKNNINVKIPVLERANNLNGNRAPFLIKTEKWREINLFGNEPLGSIICIINAKDDDNDYLLDYFLQKIFALKNIKEGAELILIKNIFEFTNNEEIILKFSLSDGLDTIHDKIIIHLNNLNIERNKVFVENNIFIEIFNEMPIGHILYKPKLIINKFNNNLFKYYFYLHTTDDITAFDVFNIDPLNGNIIISKQLPQLINLQQKYNYTEFLILKINRGEENENTPMFIECSSNNNNNLFEILPEGEGNINDLIYIFEAIDPDYGNSGKIKYSLIYEQKMEEEIFYLNETSGELKLIKEWPKQLNKINILIRATDFGKISRSKCQKLLNIHFLNGKLIFTGVYTDKNELNCSIYLNLKENNYLISNIFINLIPSIINNNSILLNYIEEELNKNLINENNLIKKKIKKKKKKKEEEEKEEEFLPSSEIYLDEFLKENNNEKELFFKFPQQIYNITILEGRPLKEKTFLLSLWPIQISLGVQLEFKLIFKEKEKNILKNIFQLNKINGILWLINNELIENILDREKYSKIQFGIKVKGGKNLLSSICLIQIILEDINDNPPIFNEQKYLINVYDDYQIGEQLIQLNATDYDIGINGIIIYEYLNILPSFIKLNKLNGCLIICSLISSEYINKTFNINIYAIDKGLPQLKSNNILIILNIIETKIPIFSAKIYRVEMTEMIKTFPIPLIQLKAEIPERNNTKIGYKIKTIELNNKKEEEEELNNNNIFNLDFNNGLLYLNNNYYLILFNNNNYINLTIEAINLLKLNNSKSGITNVIIYFPSKYLTTTTITTITTTIPTTIISFKYPIFKWNISKNTLGIGTLIGQLELLNNNNNLLLPINYSLLINNKNENKIIININQLNGQVYLITNLLKEKQKIYEYNVLALIKLENGNIESCEGIIQIKIINEEEEEEEKEKEENNNNIKINEIKEKNKLIKENNLLNEKGLITIKQNNNNTKKEVKNKQKLNNNEILNNLNNDWLQQFVNSNRLILLLLPTCLLSLVLISFILFICCRYCLNNQNNQNNQKRKKRKLIGNKGGNGGTITYSGSFTRGNIEFSSQNRKNQQIPDPACNPLVPRKTTANQIIIEQQQQPSSSSSPPPRPPRYRRDNNNGLPTVEVKPIMNKIIQQQQQNNNNKKEINNTQLLLHSFGLPLNKEELINNKEIIKEKEEINNKKSSTFTSNSSSPSSSDYLTMKPVHRAKPFISNNLDNKVCSSSSINSSPPPPPQHKKTFNKLYDCPIEDDEENE
ncbi:hypothetical protein Mgra_00001742 [Meloidogyne graminicola]|uniref:Cadherin domain-containing protein n=1 Tax=Meloidogyne graminicola TaxID=189291 RepID=A0A8S9ZZY7_9BILA|nr:hypothetical protein Mgra_00001742 [Meloidogyne graminicola]